MKTITLTKGMEAKVDNVDYPVVNQWKWHCLKIGYAARTVCSKPKRSMIYMHRQVAQLAGLSLDHEIDHINGDKLDNRRCNLREATKAQNNMNRKVLRKGKSSKYRGVSYYKQMHRWEAYIKLPDRKVRLGYFEDELEAAKAYNQAAKKHYGEFANLNDIERVGRLPK